MKEDLIEQALLKSEQMVHDGADNKKILEHLVNTAESLTDNKTVSSILLLDAEGLLRNGASPGLPPDYLKAIDGLKPDPRVGTCAAAAATGRMVITEDFHSDDKWAELKHLPTALGFEGAWSMPIKTPSGKVVGTFGTYFMERRLPSEEEIKSVRKLAEAAAKILK
jgi:GAF domain-containing protein